MPDPQAHPGELTKRTFVLRVSGPTCIGQSISRVEQSISCSREHQDIAAAKRFFIKAIGNNEAPAKITLDGYKASHQAVAQLKAEGVLSADVEVRTSKYVNNLIEQDHRRVKQRYYPMLGFKSFSNAAVTLSGIRVSAENQEGAVRHIKH